MQQRAAPLLAPARPVAPRVVEPQRPHRMAIAQRHRLVDLLGTGNALFQHARSLMTSRPRQLMIAMRDSHTETVEALVNLGNAILRQIQPGHRPRDIYQLKSLTSTIMLMPALYWQARYSEGIYKRDSFELARRDFDPDDWLIMDVVSGIRSDWHYRLTRWQKRMLTGPLALRKQMVRLCSPALSKKQQAMLNDDFYAAIGRLIERMLTSAR